MQIETVAYNDDRESEWDNFIETNKRNATFLHSRKFFNHNPLNKIADASLLFYKKKNLISVLPASLYKQENKIIFHSHPRSTYGGFVINEKVGTEEAIEIVEATINFAKSKSADEIIIRNPFRIFHQLPSDETDYAMWYHGFKIKSREMESTVLLDENIKQLYEDGTKRSIKKALENVTVNFSGNYKGYWQMLTDNLLKKHGVNPTHNYEQFLSLQQNTNPEFIRLVTAETDGNIAGGILLFLTKKVLHAQYIASDAAYQNLRPLNAVIDFIISWGIKNNYTYLNLGSANEEGGRKINYGLFKFKEGFGGRGILRETMHLQLS